MVNVNTKYIHKVKLDGWIVEMEWSGTINCLCIRRQSLYHQKVHFKI